MNFFPSKLAMTLAVSATALAAPAQQTIIFSEPSDLPANKVDSSSSSAIHLWGAGAYSAPREPFKDYTPDFPMPAPQPVRNHASVQEALNKSKNWTLMTPAQILGIQTPEQILGVPDTTGESKLPLEQQFLLREHRAMAMAATNGRAGNLVYAPDANPFADKTRNDENNPFRVEPQKTETDTRFFSQLLNVQTPKNEPNQKSDSMWNSPFSQPSQPKQTPDQLADMERFRSLMEPTTPTPDNKIETPTRFTVQKISAPDPFIQRTPVVNPAGRAVPSLDNIFSRPAGIKPLPGISTPAPTPVATKPTWQAQPPPWMNSGPPQHSQNF